MSSPGFSLSDAVSGGFPGMSKALGVLSQKNADTSKQMDTMAKDLTAGNEADEQRKADLIEKAKEPGGALKPPVMQPPPQATQTNPLQIWGSSAMWMAALGGLLTRRPLINSLNASAAVLNAYKQHDKEATDAAFNTWKVENDNAIKMFQFANDALKEELSAVNESEKTRLANFQVRAKALGFEQAGNIKNFDEAERLVIAQRNHLDKMIEAGQRIAEKKPEMDAKLDALKAVNNLQAARQSGDPKKIAAATQAVKDASERLAVFKAGAAGEPDTTTPQDKEAAGAQAATGMPLNQIIPGYGKQAVEQRRQARSDAISQIMSENPGMTAAQAGVELANRTIEFQAGKRSEGQLITMRGATKQSVEQLDYNIDKATEEMRKLPSTDISPVINAIARGEEKWTGAPAYSGLFFFMHAAAVESARILSGGQASTAQLHQGAMEEAQQWSNINMTPASWKEVSAAMKGEGRQRLKTYEDAIDYQRQHSGKSKPDDNNPPPPKDNSGGDYSHLWK